MRADYVGTDYAGRDVFNAPDLFSKEPEFRPVPVFNPGGAFGTDVVLRDNLKNAVSGVQGAGVKVSEDVTRLLDALEGVSTFSVDGSVPVLAGMSREEMTDALADVVRVRSQRAAVADAKAEFTERILADLQGAVRALIPAALDALRKRFDGAVSIYLADHDVLATHPNITSAAEADQTGETVTRYHNARKAHDELTTVADILFALRGKGAPKGSDIATGLYPGLFADFSDAEDVLVLASATPASVMPRIGTAIVAAGGGLSLPTSLDDWNDRAETYTAAVDDARLKAFPR